MRISFFIVILLMFSSGSQAQKKQSVLWEISGNGVKKASYLLGTIHVMPASVLTAFPKLQSIMQSSDKGLFEGSDSVDVDPELEKKMNPPLDSIFSPEQYAIVDTFFINHNYGSIKEYNDNADLLAMFQLAMRLRAFKDSGTGYDDRLAEYMQQFNKPLSRLDDPNLVAKQLLKIWPPRLIANELVNYIKGSATSVLMPGGDEETYTQSLTAGLHLESSSPVNKAWKVFVDERNLIWLPKIESQIKTGQCFIAVGLGHLRYKQGLISLLRKKGYKLKPVLIQETK